ncbi:dihydrodipicolinate synthase family protein [Streptomyces sp. NPDC017940]|uniref:dihydrodipicolinate synthase family protein n=1 Tax=Streptomyces sp. NPDC017940 TaxID=3365017 RepID=UPI00378BA62E
MGLFGHPGRWEGVIACPLTPYDAAGDVDGERYAQQVEFLIASGVPALCAPMHVGESLNLSFAERELLATLTVRAARGRVPVVVHVSCPGTGHTVRLARHAQSAGADAVIATASYHWDLGEEATARHFEALVTAVDVPVIGYSPPPTAGTPLPAELITRLARRHGNFLGLKEASNHMATFGAATRAAGAARPDFSVLGGIEYLLPQRSLGGAGAFSICAPVAPRLVMALWQAARDSDQQRARELQARMTRLLALLVPRYPAGVKAAVAIMGRAMGDVRLPLTPLTAAQTHRLAAALEQEGITASEPHGWDAAANGAPGHLPAAGTARTDAQHGEGLGP